MVFAWICLPELFLEKNRQYPTKARVAVGGGIFVTNSVQCLREEEFRSLPSATLSKRSVEMRAQKQVVSG